MKANIQEIRTFDTVIPFLEKRTLIVCDVDYTLVDYGKPFAHFLKGVQEAEAYKAYDDYIRAHEPRHTDPAGFIRLMKEVLHTDSHLIFVTARPSPWEGFTRKEFTSLNLDYDFFEVYYLNGQCKAEFCQGYIKGTNKEKGFEQVFLIDDYKKNIQAFQDLMPGSRTFLFRCE